MMMLRKRFLSTSPSRSSFLFCSILSRKYLSSAPLIFPAAYSNQRILLTEIKRKNENLLNDHQISDQIRVADTLKSRVRNFHSCTSYNNQSTENNNDEKNHNGIKQKDSHHGINTNNNNNNSNEDLLQPESMNAVNASDEIQSKNDRKIQVVDKDDDNHDEEGEELIKEEDEEVGKLETESDLNIDSKNIDSMYESNISDDIDGYEIVHIGKEDEEPIIISDDSLFVDRNDGNNTNTSSTFDHGHHNQNQDYSSSPSSSSSSSSSFSSFSSSSSSSSSSPSSSSSSSSSNPGSLRSVAASYSDEDLVEEYHRVNEALDISNMSMWGNHSIQNSWAVEPFRPLIQTLQTDLPVPSTPPHLSVLPVVTMGTRPPFPGQPCFAILSNQNLINSLSSTKGEFKHKYVALLFKKSKTERENSKFTQLSPKPSYEASSINTSSTSSSSSSSSSASSFSSISSSLSFRLSDYDVVGLLGEVYALKENFVFFLCHHRILPLNLLTHVPYPLVRVTHHPDPPPTSPEVTALNNNNQVKEFRRHIVQCLHQLMKAEGIAFPFRQRIYWHYNDRDPGQVVDYWASISKSDKLRSILNAFDLKDRLALTLKLLQYEVLVVERQKEIHNINVGSKEEREKQILTEQRDLLQYNMELLEPNSNNNKQVKLYQERVKGKILPPIVQSVMEEELEKLLRSDTSMFDNETSINKNYLDLITSLPWGQLSPDRLDVAEAELILEREHYGMNQVKTRIIELIAIGKLQGEIPRGKIICLVGPPGVGKTSIGRSIARALNRSFCSISLGGVDDIADIKGHRRTYTGSMPGKFVSSLKKVGVMNPVILLDEIDKLGRGGSRGDPAAALLEVLDSEQNHSFVDHYLDIPIDLSKVLFICTANTESTLPSALADRMEFIEVGGYSWKEKIEIVRAYLEPQGRLKSGIREDQLLIDDQALMIIVTKYCREAGVRQIQKILQKIYGKAAIRLVEDSNSKLRVDSSNLIEWIGQPEYSSTRLYQSTPIGVANGLAWTDKGGDAIYIEASVANPIRKTIHKDVTTPKNITSQKSDLFSSSSSGLFCTGQLSSVLEESASLAYTNAKYQLTKIQPNSLFFHLNRIHLHLPSTSSSSILSTHDQASAGLPMMLALLSLATSNPLPPLLASSGELSLTGRILGCKSSSIRSKLLALKEANLTSVLLPNENRRDVEELPIWMKEGINIIYVNTVNEVINHIFVSYPETPQSVAPITDLTLNLLLSNSRS